MSQFTSDNSKEPKKEEKETKPLSEKITDAIVTKTEAVKKAIAADQTNTELEEKISHNAKIILLALFTLVGGIVALGSFVLLAKPDISTEVLTIIFSTAITGCFTLGGVLINAIWGK